MIKYLLLLITTLIFIQYNGLAQKKKYCVVYYDQSKVKTDSTFSKSVVSNVVKVRHGDAMKVKKEFNKKWNLKYGKHALDTNLLQVIWHDSKPKAKKKQQELIDFVNKHPDAKLLMFSFEFEFEFSFEIGNID